jgi:alpha-tubulin suppressor-like RCC1 family protein
MRAVLKHIRLVAVVLFPILDHCGSRTGLDTNGTRDASVGADTFGVEAVSFGTAHCCALLRDHTVRCWGFNSSGQVGNGKSDGEDVLRATPVLGPERSREEGVRR